MEFNKPEFKMFREDLRKALESLEKEYGVKISQGAITYSSSSFTLKLTAEKTVGKNGQELDPEKEKFVEWCRLYNLTPEDYKAECRVLGTNDKFIISGINERARKNAIKITRKSDGKQFVCSRSAIKLNRS